MQSDRMRGFTLVELLVVIAIIGVLVALLLPAIQAAREAARRAQCQNHIRQLGIASHDFLDANKTFPAGMDLHWQTIGAPLLQVYPMQEASFTGPNNAHGRSWMFLILPYIEQGALYDAWDLDRSLVNANNIGPDGEPLGATDIDVFYCPSRRATVRDEDRLLMFPFLGDPSQNWSRGGTDYGGCIGSSNYFGDDGFKSKGPFEHKIFDVTPLPVPKKGSDRAPNPYNIGIFHGIEGVAVSQVEDGLSNTIAIGEMQRLWFETNPLSISGTLTKGAGSSYDGWACAGVGSLFATAPRPYGALNNWFYESPGSEHPGGAYFAMGDASVRFLSENIDTELFANLGSRADSLVGAEENPFNKDSPYD